MALMTAAQSDFVLDHDETKSPVSSKRNAVAAPDTVIGRHDQRGPDNATPMSLDAAMRAEC
ncbi:hypothetical protein MY11210_006599 [Beauveria gryllotalpidicola]